MKKESLLLLILALTALVLLTLTGCVLFGRQNTPPPTPDTKESTSTPEDTPLVTPGSPVTPTTDSKASTEEPAPVVSIPPELNTDPSDETDPPSSETAAPVTDPPATDPPQTDPPKQEPGKIQHVYAGSLPASEEVTDAWFADALFLGDSRTVGLANFSGVASTYYALTSLNISTAFTKAFLEEDEQSYTILEKVEKDGPVYSKVYLWFGLNELGWPSVASFINLYQKLIRELQVMLPDAQFYVISVVPVSQKVSDTSKYGVTNPNCHTFNTAIAKMADDLDIYFVNAAEDFADETGALRAQTRDGKKISVDGIHFNTSAVKEFFAYLRTHTVALNA